MNPYDPCAIGTLSLESLKIDSNVVSHAFESIMYFRVGNRFSTSCLLWIRMILVPSTLYLWAMLIWAGVLLIVCTHIHYFVLGSCVVIFLNMWSTVWWYACGIRGARARKIQKDDSKFKIQKDDSVWIRGSARVAYAAPARALVRVWHTWRPRALIRNRHAWTHARWHCVCHRQNLSLLDIKVYASGLAINSICRVPNLTILAGTS